MPTEPEIPMRIALHCGGPFSQRMTRCHESVEATIAELSVHPQADREARVRGWMDSLRAVGWFVTTVTPPGEGYIVWDILCPKCAPKVLAPELYQAALAAGIGKVSQ